VASVRESATLADAVACVRSRGHMKLPVFAEDGSRCIGVLYTQDVLANLLESGAESVTRHMQPPFFLADNVRADDVLPLLRRNRQHLALIRDAGGKVLGIVTVENILKILVGNLPASATGNRKTDPAPAILPSPTP
jgi:CBS domain containing-hemolysin-like protein